jgi:hypothetical protein
MAPAMESPSLSSDFFALLRVEKSPAEAGQAMAISGGFRQAGPPTSFAWQRSLVWRQVADSGRKTGALMSSVIANTWME